MNRDVFDSRDVDTRIDELEGGFITSDETEELNFLIKLRDDVDSPEWKYGIQFINEDYFVEYTKDMLTDIGDLPPNVPWYIEIDWEKTAENIKVDYRDIEINGETYWFRD